VRRAGSVEVGVAEADNAAVQVVTSPPAACPVVNKCPTGKPRATSTSPNWSLQVASSFRLRLGNGRWQLGVNFGLDLAKNLVGLSLGDARCSRSSLRSSERS
jgi:hypothetical protein